MKKIGSGIYKLFFLVALGVILSVGIYVFKSNPQAYKISASEIEYKFESANSTQQSEFDFVKKKVESTGNPDLLDLASLADLYVTEAKKTGNTAYYDKAEKLAQSILKQSLNQAIQLKSAHLTMVNVMTARHQFKEALEKLDKIFGVQMSEDTAYPKALIYLALNKFDDAFAQINFLIKAKPSMATATLKALVLSHVGQDDLAFHYFKRAIQLEDINENSQSVLTRGQFATFLIKKGQYADAIKICDTALKIIPANNFIKHVKAQAYNAQKDYEKAYQLLSAAFAESKDPVYLLQMVYSLKLLNKENDFNILTNQAIAIFKTEVELKNYGHLADLAGLYYVMGDDQNAIRTVMLDQESKKTLRTDLILAKALIRTKKTEQARDIVEGQIAKNSTDASLDYLMVEILNGNSNKNLREIYLSRAKAKNNKFNLDQMMKIP